MNLVHPPIKPLAYAPVNQTFADKCAQIYNGLSPSFVLCGTTKLFFFQQPEILKEMIDNEETITGNPLVALKLPCVANDAVIIWPYCVLLSEKAVFILSININDMKILLEKTCTISLQHSATHLAGCQLSEKYMFVAYSTMGVYSIFNMETVVAHATILKSILGCYFWDDCLVIVNPTEIQLYGRLASRCPEDNSGGLECIATYPLNTANMITASKYTCSQINVQFLQSKDAQGLYILINKSIFLLTRDHVKEILYTKDLFSDDAPCIRGLSFIQDKFDQNMFIVHTMDTMIISTISPVRQILRLIPDEDMLVTFSALIADNLLLCISRTTGIFYVPFFQSLGKNLSFSNERELGYVYTNNLILADTTSGAFITAPNLPIHYVLVTENDTVLLCETPNVNVEFLGSTTFRENGSTGILSAGKLVICERNIYYQDYWNYAMQEPTRDTVKQIYLLDGNSAAPPDHYLFVTNNQLVVYRIVFIETANSDSQQPSLKLITQIDIPHSYGHNMVVHNMVSKIVYEDVDIISIALQCGEKGQLLDFPCLWDADSGTYSFMEPNSVENFQFPQLLTEKSVDKMIYGFPNNSDVMFFISTLNGEILFRYSNHEPIPLDNSYIVESRSVDAGDEVDILINLKDKADKVPICCQFFRDNLLSMIKESHTLIIFDFQTFQQNVYELRGTVSAVVDTKKNVKNLGIPKALIQTSDHLIVLIDLDLYYISLSGKDRYYDLYHIYSHPILGISRINSANSCFIALSSFCKQVFFFVLSITQSSDGLFFEDKWTFEGHNLFIDDINTDVHDIDINMPSVQTFQSANTMMLYFPKKQQLVTYSVTIKARNVDIMALNALPNDKRAEYLCDLLMKRRKYRKILVNLEAINREHKYEHRFTHLHFFTAQNSSFISLIFEKLDLNIYEMARNHVSDTNQQIQEEIANLRSDLSGGIDLSQKNAILYGIFGYCSLSRRLFLLALFLDCETCPLLFLRDNSFENVRAFCLRDCKNYMTAINHDPAFIFLKTSAKNCSPELSKATLGPDGIIGSCQIDDKLLVFTSAGYCYMYELIENYNVNSRGGKHGQVSSAITDLITFRLNSYTNVCELVHTNATGNPLLVCVGQPVAAVSDESIDPLINQNIHSLYLILNITDSYYLLIVDFYDTLHTVTYSSLTPLLCTKPTSMLILKNYAVIAWKNKVLLLHLPEAVLLRTYTVSNEILNVYYSRGQIIVFTTESKIWRLNLSC